MFRHPNLKHSNGTLDDFEKKIDQSIRYFKVPAMKDKEGALNLLLAEIAKTEEAPKKQGAKIRKIYFTVGSVAAAACVLLFVAYSFFMVQTYQGGDQFGSNVVFLPDDSRVVLADGAEIKFSKFFFQRSVQLKGEAYFEVQKGSNFYVNTKQGGVLVIGTRFTVNDHDNTFDVHCYEGVVGVDYNHEKIRLDAGMGLSAFNSTFNVKQTNDTGYPQFAVFDYTCHNLKLNELWPVVENYFGIEIESSAIPEESFTGQFHTGNVQEVIDIVCTSMHMDFNVVSEDQVIIKMKENK